MGITDMCWGGTGYAAYALELRSKAGDNEKAAQQNSQTDRAAAGVQDTDANSDLSDIEGGGSIFDSPIYKTSVGMSTDSTARAYDNVRANRMARAASAGMGYQQPITQADSSAVDMDEARTMGDIPRQTALSLEPLRMQAGGMRLGQATSLRGNATGNLGISANLEKARLDRRAQLIGGIVKAGVGIGSKFINPVGAAADEQGGG